MKWLIVKKILELNIHQNLIKDEIKNHHFDLIKKLIFL